MFRLSVLRGVGSSITDVAPQVETLGKTVRGAYGCLLLYRDFHVTENVVFRKGGDGTEN